jgi:hypothetical protein
MPRPRIILALVPGHVFFAASLVLLAHSLFNAIDVYLDNIAGLLSQNWEQSREYH